MHGFMQQTKNLILLGLAGVAANVSGAVQTIRTEDTFTIFVNATGGSVGATVSFEALSPDGVSWHRFAQTVLVAAGPMPVTVVAGMPLSAAIRATVSSWTAGQIFAYAVAGSYSRD